jgi:hypothetical protein
VLGIDGRACDRHRDRRRPERGDPPSQMRRQNLLELDEGADGGLLDAGHRCPGGGPQPDRDGDRLVLVEQQRRHRRAGAQPVAAGRPGQRLDRVAERAQALDVAPDRATGDIKPRRQLRTRPVATSLKQRQEVEQPAGGLEHAQPMIFEIEDRC